MEQRLTTGQVATFLDRVMEKLRKFTQDQQPINPEVLEIFAHAARTAYYVGSTDAYIPVLTVVAMMLRIEENRLPPIIQFRQIIDEAMRGVK